ncbi:bifunctional MaoC family dehydratase N-terminal/OB-fold nucleic acid binding domain-containing protein [Crossiella sp. CA-258035]|uniref:bifunctional MaoC family dehydratase N-terminal/OB-fold nucleic acid binding domain-containing protein n=1 Tax=Crossiella sp. CA-258035 TaxID=2981138 RepID=UPI0024BCC97C|nr:bifunctional MaoC family dehydratase N-terminal/OB-fold nucleic acid binding domain-containing protein [Crossiella sp. CA-258035]WHT17229.1 bifunctional MaoC family dehydratase N-terminal/OB-fold nucleic acid binding domain-containing protein [Crossiella sp. CA-258035]
MTSTVDSEEAVRAAAERIAATGVSGLRFGRDPVNEPMIRSWTEALGDTDPRYPELAPPAMAQVWTMMGLHGERDPADPFGQILEVLDEAGYPSIVATNCEQTYHRYLKPGETLAVTTRLDQVTGPKRTALGEGWFVTVHNTWYSGAEAVAEMLFRVYKYRPAPPPSPAGIPPLVSRDTEFFWAGTALGELRIQRCGACGELRHPPGPMCPRCHELRPEHVVVSGLGTVYSFVVHHHPAVPGHTGPFVIALVELAEGPRMVSELLDVEPSEVHIGQSVRVEFQRRGEFSIPAWRAVRA